MPSAESESQPENSKKRKRDEVNESDPKLQEFLNVMQPAKTSTSKIHGVVTDLVDEPPAKYAALVEEGASDDEYEVVPSRRKKSQPLENAKPVVPIVSVANGGADGQPQTEPDIVEEPREEAVPTATSVVETTPGATATDDDWLRSRTNRLLDLVDDEDIVPTTVPLENQPSVPPVQEQEPEVVDATLDEDQVMKDPTPQPDEDEPDTETKIDTLDTVRKTKRLFVRNLPYSATEDELRSYFERFGDVEEVSLSQ